MEPVLHHHTCFLTGMTLFVSVSLYTTPYEYLPISFFGSACAPAGPGALGIDA